MCFRRWLKMPSVLQAASAFSGKLREHCEAGARTRTRHNLARKTCRTEGGGIGSRARGGGPPTRTPPRPTRDAVRAFRRPPARPSPSPRAARGGRRALPMVPSVATSARTLASAAASLAAAPSQVLPAWASAARCAAQTVAARPDPDLRTLRKVCTYNKPRHV